MTRLVRPGRHRQPAWRLAMAGALVGAVVLTGSILVACQSDAPPPNVGGSEVASLAAPTTSAAVGPSSTIPIVPGTLPAPRAAIQPTRLRIPSIGVSSTVKPVGIDPATGDFAVPPSVDVVGWYKFGPGLEATAGSVVIAGHVDSSVQGAGAFFQLRRLGVGDQLSVVGSDGRTRAFKVVAREEWPKSKIPLDRYFARDGELRLTLITCGGPFDAATRNYRDNIVVTAVPA